MCDIATIIIAFLVALIAWREWLVNRTRLQIELFDRRYAVYERITGFIANVLQTGTVESGSEIALLRDTKQAYFLFGGDPTIKELINNIYHNAVDLECLEKRLSSLTDDKARKDNTDKQIIIKEFLKNTLSSIEKTFEKYLAISELSVLAIRFRR